MKSFGATSSTSSNRTEALEFYTKGVRCLSNESFTRAITEFTQAIKLFPKKTDKKFNQETDIAHLVKMYGGRGYAYRQTNDTERAISDFKKVVEIDPSLPRTYYNLGAAYYSMGRFDDAIDALSKEITAYPNSEDTKEAYVMRAYCYNVKGDLAAVIKDCNRSLRYQSQDANEFILRGSCYFRSKNYGQAIADFKAALKLKPGEKELVDTHFNLALSYIDIPDMSMQKKNLQAIFHFTQAIEYSRINDELYLGRGRLYSQMDQFDKAITDFQEAIALNAESFEAYQELGLAYFLKGDFENAMKAYQVSLKMDKNPNIWFLIGKYHEKMNDLNQAINAYTESMALNTENAGPFYHRGSCYIGRNNKQKGDSAAAIVDLLRAVELDPSLSLYLLALAYFKNNEFQNALTMLSKAIDNNSNDPLLWSKRGQIYYESQQLTLAFDDCTKALELDETNLEANFYLGLMAIKQNNTTEAHLRFKKMIEHCSFDTSVTYSSSALIPSSLTLELIYLRGLAYYYLGEFDKSVADFTFCITHDPNSEPRYYNNRGLSYKELGEYANALEDCSRAIILSDQQLTVAYYNRASIYYKMKQYEQASADYTTYLEQNSLHGDAYLNRGSCYYRLGQYGLASNDYQKTLTLLPNDPDALKNLELIEKVAPGTNGNAFFTSTLLDGHNQVLPDIKKSP